LFLFYSAANKPVLIEKDADGGALHVKFIIRLGEYESLLANPSGQAWKLKLNPAVLNEAKVGLTLGSQGELAAYLKRSSNVVAVAGSSASSVAVTNTAAAAADGSMATAWGAATNDSAGAWLEFGFKKRCRLTKVTIANGCSVGQPEGTFSRIHRAQNVTLVTDEGQRCSWRLCDVWFPQTYTLKTPVETQRARIVVDAIYPAEELDPASPPALRIAEVAFFGEPVAGKTGAMGGGK
jgi:hypothetical protein